MARFLSCWACCGDLMWFVPTTKPILVSPFLFIPMATLVTKMSHLPGGEPLMAVEFEDLWWDAMGLDAKSKAPDFWRESWAFRYTCHFIMVSGFFPESSNFYAKEKVEVFLFTYFLSQKGTADNLLCSSELSELAVLSLCEPFWEPLVRPTAKTKTDVLFSGGLYQRDPKDGFFVFFHLLCLKTWLNHVFGG